MRRRDAILFAVVLAAAYYAKSSMFFLGGVLATLLFWVVPLDKQPRWHLAVALAVALSMPLIFLTTEKAGHVTIGDAAAINYGIYIDGTPGLPTWKSPVHPVRFSDGLMTYGERPGTNPLSYDAAYWYAGMNPRFNLSGQLRAIKVTLRTYVGFLPSMAVLLVGAFVLYGFRLRTPIPALLGWAVCACLLYGIVHIESRYIAPFVVLFWVAVFSAKADTAASKRATLAVVAGTLLFQTLVHLRQTPDSSQSDGVRVGKALQAAGIEPGDLIATAGGWEDSRDSAGGQAQVAPPNFLSPFAGYVGAKIVASWVDETDGLPMKNRPAPSVWRLSDDELRQRMSQIGVKAIVGFRHPTCCWWIVPGTEYSILVTDSSASRAATVGSGGNN